MPSGPAEDNSLQATSLCLPPALPVCGLNQQSQGGTALWVPWQAALTYTASTLAPVAFLTGQASVGARGVDASPIRTGARLTTFVDICKTTKPLPGSPWEPQPTGSSMTQRILDPLLVEERAVIVCIDENKEKMRLSLCSQLYLPRTVLPQERDGRI